MNKYVLKVIVVATNDPTHPTTISLPDTTFIAVSAYQSMAVTQMKIDNNPYAKAFKYKEERSSAIPISGGPSASELVLPCTLEEVTLPTKCIVTVSPERLMAAASYQQQRRQALPMLETASQQLQASQPASQLVLAMETPPQEMPALQPSSQQTPVSDTTPHQISVLQSTSQKNTTGKSIAKHVSVLQTAPQQVSVLKSASRKTRSTPRSVTTTKKASGPPAKQEKEPPALIPDVANTRRTASKEIGGHKLKQGQHVTTREVVTRKKCAPVTRQLYPSKPVGRHVAPPQMVTRRVEPAARLVKPVARQAERPLLVTQHPAPQAARRKLSPSEFGSKRFGPRLPLMHAAMFPHQLARRVSTQHTALQHVTPQGLAAGQRQHGAQKNAMQYHFTLQELASDNHSRQESIRRNASQPFTSQEIAAEQLLQQQQFLRQLGVRRQISPEEIAAGQFLQQRLISRQLIAQGNALQQLAQGEIAAEQLQLIPPEIAQQLLQQQLPLQPGPQQQLMAERLHQQQLLLQQPGPWPQLITQEMAEQLLQQQLGPQRQLTAEQLHQLQLLPQQQDAQQLLTPQEMADQLLQQQLAMRHITPQALASGQLLPPGMYMQFTSRISHIRTVEPFGIHHKSSKSNTHLMSKFQLMHSKEYSGPSLIQTT